MVYSTNTITITITTITSTTNSYNNFYQIYPIKHNFKLRTYCISVRLSTILNVYTDSCFRITST